MGCGKPMLLRDRKEGRIRYTFGLDFSEVGVFKVFYFFFN